MQPLTITDADQLQADAATGGELLRLRRDRIVMERRITELEAALAESHEQLRRVAQGEGAADG